MKAPQLLFVFLPLVGNAQRIVPIDAVFDGSNVQINAMVEFNGKLIIGGQFVGMNGQVAPNILAWDGGTGVDDLGLPMLIGQVNTIISYGDGVVFGGAGNLAARKVFYWNGDTTVVLGSLGSGSIECFAEFNGDLIVGGSFTSIDGVPVSHIAQWDGSAWSTLGLGLNGTPLTMAMHDGALFIGGWFTATSDNAQQLRHIASWSGTALQPLDSGLDDNVTELLGISDELWLAGNFSTTGDSTLALERFAVWDSNGFAPLLSGVSPNQTGHSRLVDLRGFGIMARAEKYDDRVFTNGEWRKTWLRGIDCAEEFQGVTFVGGQLENDAPDSSIALGKLLSGSGHTELEIAGLKAWVRSDGCLFYDQELNRPDLIPTSEGAASTIFASAHYVVGYVGDSAFTSSFSPYANKENYSQGPRCADRSTVFTDRYQRSWPIDIGMLWEHAANWVDPGYTAPEVLTDWPGNGDAGNGEPGHIAAFQDDNADGVYEPDQGELPSIKGDKAVLVEVSDQAADGQPEIFPSMFDSELLVHGYDSSPPEVLYQTLFVTYRLTNRSDRTYDSVVVALVSDLNLGCQNDDILGCDPELDMFYVYNATDTDQFCSAGFGAHSPAQGIVGLSSPMRSFINYNREGPSFMTDPHTTLDATRYAEGVWKDGSPIINTVTNEPTRFMFNEYPDVPGGYHEEALTNPDRRGIASFGPFYDVAPGDRICLDMAFVFARDTTQDNIQNTRVLQEKVIALKEWYAQQGLSCDDYTPVGVPEGHQPTEGLLLFPDPVADETVLLRQNAEEPAFVTIVSMTGSVLERYAWGAGARQLTLRVGGLTPGVYLVRMVSGGRWSTIRLVVAH